MLIFSFVFSLLLLLIDLAMDCTVHCIMCTVHSVIQAHFIYLIIKIVNFQTKIKFKKEQCKSNYLYTKQFLQGQIELILEPPATEPSLVSFSISNQNHITVHGFHICLHPWLVSGLLSSSYGTQCTVYSIQCDVGTVFLFDYHDCKILNQS